jgi:hypothetical protein
MTQPKWQFASRFRRHAFGWRSDTPILRIKEAVVEIKAVAKRDPVLAAEGAIKLLEKLSPALEQVDSSSGAVGTAVTRAIDALVPIISGAQVDRRTRHAWLHRLWDAAQDDQLSYLKGLDDHWGELCVVPELASAWADVLLPLLHQAWSPDAPSRGYFSGTNVCLSCLAAAGRHDELLALLERSPYNSWGQRVWGVRALVAMGREVEALQYAEASRDINAPLAEIDRTCEEILLSSSMAEEAYRRYALTANTGNTNLATFRAIAKKYPH